MKRQRVTRRSKAPEENFKKEKFLTGIQFPVLKPLNNNQAGLLESFRYCSIVAATGSAGTGKTYLACWHAAKKLRYKDIKKVVLIRAYQPLAGRSIGFLPGELEDKLKPYYQQMLDYFEDFLGKGETEIHVKNKTIEICSLETIRGRSWNDCIIIVDESQSLMIPEVQALVTRVGDNSQIIFCGDDSGVQTDVKNAMNGLTYLQKIVQKYSISDSAFVKFTRDDIVRSALVKEFVIAFEEELITYDPIISQEEVDKQFRKQR